MFEGVGEVLIPFIVTNIVACRSFDQNFIIVTVVIGERIVWLKKGGFD